MNTKKTAQTTKVLSKTVRGANKAMQESPVGASTPRLRSGMETRNIPQTSSHARDLLGARADEERMNIDDDSEEDEPRERILTERQRASVQGGGNFANKSIVENTNRWRYATPLEMNDPGATNVFPLIQRKWIQGVKANTFTMNKNPGERKYDWDLYVEYIDTLISIQGYASQWQKALLLKTVVGEELLTIIINNEWLPKNPIEGIMHYDVLKQHIGEYFKGKNRTLMVQN